MKAVFRRARAALALLAAVSLFQGCGGTDYEVVPVSGKITFGGRPAANINVTFQPKSGGQEGGRGSFGVTDAEGRFTLRTVDPEQDGAVVGKHVVRLARVLERELPEDQILPKRFRLPEKCNDGSLTFAVPPEGTSEANFNL